MTQPIQEPTTQRSVSGLDWGQSQLARRPAPAASTAPVIRAVLYGGAGDTADTEGLVPVRFDSAYILNDPDGDVFQLNVINTNDPDGLDRFQLQLLQTNGWYRIECVIAMDDSSFAVDGEAFLVVPVGLNPTFVDARYFPASVSQLAGPYLRVVGEYDAGAVWFADGHSGSIKIDPQFGHTFAGQTLGWDTDYLKVQYLGDMGDVNASPWESFFIPPSS